MKIETALKINEVGEMTINSTELVEIINNFREVEGNRSVLRHCDFMAKIKKEIETLEGLGISNLRNFSYIEYVDNRGRIQPCYELTRSGMLQILNSESALVRYKTIEYINKLEDQLRYKPMSAMELMELQFKVNKEFEQQIQQVDKKIERFKKEAPLFNNECDELQKKLKKRVVNILGGTGSAAYKDRPLRTKIYKDAQNNIKRNFGVETYKSICRGQLEKALEIVECYEAPYILQEEIDILNSYIVKEG